MTDRKSMPMNANFSHDAEPPATLMPGPIAPAALLAKLSIFAGDIKIAHTDLRAAVRAAQHVPGCPRSAGAVATRGAGAAHPDLHVHGSDDRDGGKSAARCPDRRQQPAHRPPSDPGRNALPDILYPYRRPQWDRVLLRGRGVLYVVWQPLADHLLASRACVPQRLSPAEAFHPALSLLPRRGAGSCSDLCLGSYSRLARPAALLDGGGGPLLDRRLRHHLRLPRLRQRRRPRRFFGPGKVGVAPALWISRFTHLLAAGFLIQLGLRASPPFGSLYFVGVAIAITLLIVEHSLVRPTDLSKVGLAFFTVNGIISVVLGTLGIIDVVR